MSKNLAATIHVGRIFGHDLTHQVVIEINDELGGGRIIEVSMTLEQYGDLVSGSGIVHCAASLYEDRHFGKKIESKEEFVPFDWTKWHNKKDQFEKAALKAATPFLVDGWCSFRESDLQNHHRSSERKGVKGQMVVFWRYVEVAA